MKLGTIFKLDNGVYIVDDERPMVTRPGNKWAATLIGGKGLDFVCLYPNVVASYLEKDTITILRE